MTINYTVEPHINDAIMNVIKKYGFDQRTSQNLLNKTVDLYYFLLERQNDGKSNIPSKMLKDKYRITINKKQKQYTYLLGIIVQANLLFRGSSYSTGNDKTKAFAKYFQVNDMLVDIAHDFTCLNFDTKTASYNEKQKWLNKFPQFRGIINMIYETNFDLEEVKSFLESNKGGKTKKGKIIDDKLITGYLRRAIKYNQKEFRFTLTNEKRFYNPVCYVPSLIRPLLKHNGNYLVELDIKNSQPLLLSNYINCPKYKELVEKGILYDELSKLIKNTSREKIKRDIFRYILFSHRRLKSGNLFRAVNKLLPTFFDELDKIDIGENKLWQQLQIDEAKIIVYNLKKQNFIPVHDAILVLPKDKDKFYDTLINQFKNINMNVTIATNYHPDNFSHIQKKAS